jgi:hypothetical protein
LPVKSDGGSSFTGIVFLLEELEICSEAGMGTNKIITFEIKVQTLILRHGKENTDKVVFHQIKVIDAGAKGISSKGS